MMAKSWLPCVLLFAPCVVSGCGSDKSGSAPPAVPTEVITLSDGIFSLAVAGGDVLCGTEGAIQRVSTATTQAVTFATNEYAGEMVSDGTQVVWRNSFASVKLGTHDEVKFAPVGDGTKATAVAPEGSAIAFDGTFLYWTVKSATSFPDRTFEVDRAPIDGGAKTMLAPAIVDVSAMAVDATNVYFVADDALVALPKSGGPQQQLLKNATGLGGASKMLVDDTSVYYIGATGGGATSNFVAAVPKTGGPRRELFFGCQGVEDIALDGDSLYGICSIDIHGFETTPNHSVKKVAKSGGTATTIALLPGQDANADRFSAMAIAGTNVYVAFGKKLMKTPK
ncbi:MAG: hypothetical protein QOI41_2750 [Myxococcales bacterium]|jgi:hypothetical protein|nr:hypothetical protein [Myxococcales bacterium]